MNIQHGFLADYFDGIGFKRLKPVEIDPEVSHEHEFNGIDQFRKLLGADKRSLSCRVIYLSDDEDEIIEDRVELTWYDARLNHPTRSEYRLYYKESDCFIKAKPEDLMILCKDRNDDFTIFIAKNGDTIENQLVWLFGISDSIETTVGQVKTFRQDTGLDYFSNLILDKIGISLQTPDVPLLENILEQFPNGFPRTFEFSQFARSFIENIDLAGDPDTALVEWLDYEESLFRVLEKYFVEKKIKSGFQGVDDFIEFSLGVQNRRKSRAGYALENHIRYIFDSNNISYSYNKITENRARPDFIFPNIEKYRDMSFPEKFLSMLGVKTTCKDRWRQVLSEAKRIERKHLFTLEPGISVSQTDEMLDHGLQLVVPREIRSTYKAEQQRWLMSLVEFIDQVKYLQGIKT